ncbi:MAG: hypothetical protein JXD22_11640 [Sedimentisphaerales bacterium]|nr:hypothetical protein [Sedimentisphaerales bacterium]
MKSTKIPARFNGRCRSCQNPIAKGDPVWWKKEYGVKCDACGPHTEDDAALPRKNKGKAPRTRKSSTNPSASRRRRRSSSPAPSPAATMTELSADRGEYMVEFGSMVETVTNALQQEHATGDKMALASAMNSFTRPGGDSWGNWFTTDKFRRELSDPSSHYVDEVERMREELENSCPEIQLGQRIKRRVRRGQEFGDQIDPDRFLAKVPNIWERTVRELQPDRQVTIGVNLTVNGSERAAATLYRGAAVLAMADYLSAQNINVKVVMYLPVTNPTNEVKLVLGKYVVKDFCSPIDKNTLAFMLCEIAFIRLCLIGQEAGLPGRVYHGLGYAAELPYCEAKNCDIVAGREVNSKEAAIEWLSENIQKHSADKGAA